MNGGSIVDLARAGKDLPSDMRAFIALGDAGLEAAERVVRSGDGVVTGPVRLAPPLALQKNVICIGRNYKAHIEEGFRARGQEPVYPEYLEVFSKPPTTLVGHEDDIRVDRQFTNQLDYEVEFALVVGKAGRRIPTSVPSTTFTATASRTTFQLARCSAIMVNGSWARRWTHPVRSVHASCPSSSSPNLRTRS